MFQGEDVGATWQVEEAAEAVGVGGRGVGGGVPRRVILEDVVDELHPC
jgi:hypothetical protein